jgi:hypothetical protein
MKKVIRLTESELSNLIKKVINEQKLLTEEKHYDYTQKGSHSLIAKDGTIFNLPVSNVWKHQCYVAEPADWLKDSKYGIIFHCGDLGGYPQIVGKKMILNNFKNSQVLVQYLKKEYCKGNEWNNSSTSKHLGCNVKELQKKQGLESNYETQYNHILKSLDNIGQSTIIKKGFIWDKKKIGQQTAWINKNTGLYFTCDGKSISGWEEDELYRSMNINKYQGSNSLFTVMKTKLCKK